MTDKSQIIQEIALWACGCANDSKKTWVEDAKELFTKLESLGMVFKAENQALPKEFKSCGFGCEELLKDWRRIVKL